MFCSSSSSLSFFQQQNDHSSSIQSKSWGVKYVRTSVHPVTIEDQKLSVVDPK